MFPVGSQVSSMVIFFHLFSNWTQGPIENESDAMAPPVTVVQGRGNTELGPTGHLEFSLNKHLCWVLTCESLLFSLPFKLMTKAANYLLKKKDS